jgi:pimeloyl-ACP methyl ester carboxylesterase
MVVHVNGSSLYYHKEGHGKKKLLLFHGFGQDHQVFVSLARALSTQYTCYIFDLYFHGQSTWPLEEQPLEKHEWKAILESFLKEENIATFSLLGFSLGGKLVLATVEAFAAKTEAVFLLAPDGIKTSFWYNMATYPILVRRLFKSMIFHPDRFFRISQALYRLNLVDRGLIRFAEHQMNTEEKRRRVYFSWVVFRHLRFNLKKIARIINANDIRTVIVVGKHDKVIRPEAIKHLSTRLKNCRVEVLDTGHTGLINQSAEILRSSVV